MLWLKRDIGVSGAVANQGVMWCVLLVVLC